MPLEERQNTPTPTQPFHDTLRELLARLAILSVNDLQQKAPSGSINETSAIKKFEPSSGLISNFAKEFGVPLPDVLWAFSVIFSPSRAGDCVVATVLREQAREQDPTRSLFTLYLTINKGIWSSDDEKYSKKWQDAVNRAMSGTMPDFPDLWNSLTQNCKERIKGYAESAKQNVFGVTKEPNDLLKISCMETLNDIAASASSAGPASFLVALDKLLKRMERDVDQNVAEVLALLTKKCWKFLKKYGDEFQKLFVQLPKLRTKPKLRTEPTVINSLSLGHPERARYFLKTIENLAKLPRAFNTYLKFWGVLVSKESWFEIKFLPYPLHMPSNSSVLAVMSNISKLTTSDMEDATKIVRKKRNHNPHCEIQMLQYMHKLEDKSGIWNVIGCSKRQCLACAELLRASDFLFKESHGKAYFQQLLSIEEWLKDNKDMQSAIKGLNQELVESVEECNSTKQTNKYVEPDSPICQDSSSSTIRNLHRPEERDLFHPRNIQAPTLPQEPSQPNVPICLPNWKLIVEPKE
ncbi:hypothetical protein F4801DRAFT_599141 [Xylaria longipes]|nr:hypothetical protein F4801DRAFT_599141 [Xylaria longipes]